MCMPLEAAMSVTRCSFLVIPLMIAGFAGATSAQTAPNVAEQVTADTTAATNVVNPQIVRLSYVEGDVRVSAGALARHDGMQPWEQAAVNLPLETGFSMVTGKGRAEIEFEDASTMYLDSNSVLTFNELETIHGVPQTEMALLTGTATLHLRPTMQGEVYLLKTPSDSIHVPFGSRADLRVDSYLDAMTVTPQKSVAIQLNGGSAEMSQVGKSFTYSHGAVVATTKPVLSQAAEWDSWVANRVATRAEEMAAVMKEAGLETPLPGLADMKAKGRFFACEPYGTCWEPTNGWSGPRGVQSVTTGGAHLQNAVAAQSAGVMQSANAPQDANAPQNANAPRGKSKKAANQIIGGGGAAPAALDAEDDFAFPCSPFEVRWLSFDLGAEMYDASYRGPDFAMYPYSWAVCHAGSWLQGNGRYAWVVGTRRHHHCPVRWVKTGGKLGYVPIHPRDVAGKEPLNLKHGVFEPIDRKRGTLRLASYQPGKRVDVLAEAPKQFRGTTRPVLAEAKAPSVEAHVWNATQPGAKVGLADRPVNTIAFDRRAQSFTLVTRVATGDRFSTVSSPMGGRVGMAQGAGPISRGGYSGGAAGSGGRSGYSGGASSSGGHAGSSSGGSFSGGGHFSGGSVGSSGGSVGSAGASAGGAHK
jgi:hypothetical protein